MNTIKEFARVNVASLTVPISQINEEIETDGEKMSIMTSRLNTNFTRGDELFLIVLGPILFPPFIILHALVITIFAIPLALLIITLCCLCACCCDDDVSNVVMYIVGNFITSLIMLFGWTCGIALYPLAVILALIRYIF